MYRVIQFLNQGLNQNISGKQKVDTVEKYVMAKRVVL